MAVAHSCSRLAADDASSLQRLAEDVDIGLPVALPARSPWCLRGVPSACSRLIPFWGLSSTRSASRAGLTLLAPVVLVGASIDSLCAAPSTFSGSRSSLEAKPGTSPLRRAQRGYQLLCFFSSTVMSASSQSTGFFTSSILALTLSCLKNDSFGTGTEYAFSALPELVRRVVQAVDTLPAEVSSWMASSQDTPAPAVRGKESSAHTRACHVLMASATLPWSTFS